MIKLCKKFDPVVTYIYTINVWISVESLGGRTPTHKVLIYVSGHKINFLSGVDLIYGCSDPPSRRGRSSADIRAILSSPADAQLAICAAWSSTYNCSSAKFCRTTRISLLATARISWRSATGHEQIAATVWRDSRTIGRGSISDSRFELAMHKSVTTSRVVV